MNPVTSFFSKLKTHLVGWREWELNPIVVKELRQSVRSWAVTGMLLLFLTVLFGTALIFLITQSFEVNLDQTLGETVFLTFLAILTGGSLLFIPIYVGSRLATERQDSNLDLLYVTSLTPARIIRGKFLCGAYMVVLFFSACMPFMVFTNLLRGIDLPTIFFILACLFLVLCCAIQVAIFLACLPINKLLKVFIGIFCFIAGCILTGSLMSSFYFMASSGIGSSMGSGEFWINFVTWSSLVLAGMVLLHFLSVASISPLSANRALSLRTCVTCIWLLGAVVSFFWVVKQGDPRLMLPWATTSYVLLTVATVVVISNRDELSLRVRREIPANPVMRALAFLFYNGAAGGLVWLGLLVSATYGITHLMQHWLSATIAMADDLYNAQMNSAATMLYVFAYALTALFLHRRFLGGRSPKLAGLFAVSLPAIWALIPFIAFFVLNRLSWRTVESSQLGNILNVFIVRAPSQKLAHVVCATCWLFVMLLLNANWFRRQIKHFRPPEPEPPVIAVSPAVASTTAN